MELIYLDCDNYTYRWKFELLTKKSTKYNSICFILQVSHNNSTAKQTNYKEGQHGRESAFKLLNETIIEVSEREWNNEVIRFRSSIMKAKKSTAIHNTWSNVHYSNTCWRMWVVAQARKKTGFCCLLIMIKCPHAPICVDTDM